MDTIVTAILLGILEGLTEFLPVSSTGHLILAQAWFGYDPALWRQYNIIIQLGAILAVVVTYFKTFWTMGTGLLRGERKAILFVRNILLAFLPAAVIGLLILDVIDAMLESPAVVAIALIVGGIAILVLEKIIPARPDHGVAALSWKSCLTIGLVQCLAMVPGVSRSGATIMGALAMGVNRKTAAEFSFFLAVPTMIGATTLELFQKGGELTAGTMRVGWGEIAIGFVVSFIVALFVIRAFVAYVSRSGFTPFAWYRIIAGSAVLAWLTFA